jgi:hypothetical protein
MPKKECSTDANRNNSTCNIVPPQDHHNSHNSRTRHSKAMSCLSPIQECSSEYSHASRTMPSHRRGVSAFSSLAELKVQQKILQKNKPIHFTVGGNIRSECVMTAIPESHFVQKNRGPNEKDLELLGLTLPHLHEPTVRNTKDKCVLDLRDEKTRSSFTSDQRTEVSVEMPHEDEFHEEEEEDLQLSSGSIVQVHSIGSSITGELSKDDVEHREATTRHGTFKVRGMPFKKPLRKIARKVWRRVKPMLCKTRTVFKKKKAPHLQRSKGILT